MLNNATGFRKIYIAAGYTDLRRGIDGLASIIKFNFQLDPYEKDILFLFCGRRSDRIKGLVWEGDGFLLLYKRLELGGFSWPRTKEEALEITPEQYQALMKGLEIISRHDPGSVSSGSPVKHCAKRRKSKIFSHSPSRTDWKLSTAEPYCIHSIMEYLTAASCRVDKYSEKLKKLVAFSAFQSVYPMVRMTNDLFVWFAFSFVLRYNSSSKTKEHRTCQSQRSTHQKN